MGLTDIMNGINYDCGLGGLGTCMNQWLNLGNANEADVVTAPLTQHTNELRIAFAIFFFTHHLLPLIQYIPFTFIIYKYQVSSTRKKKPKYHLD